MIYAYIRVSTDRQTVENQRFEVEEWVKKKDMVVENWSEETVSGTKDIKLRVLQDTLEKLKEGDTLIVTELSRIARNLLGIMSFLNEVMNKGVFLFAIKEGYELGNNITSKVLAFAFGLSAEIERNLISQRTKEGLARRQATGLKMGRPKGRKTIRKALACSKHAETIKELLDKKTSISSIARIIGVHRQTLTDFICGKNKVIDNENYSKNKVTTAKKYISEKMPLFKSGDIDYLRKNRTDFIKLKNIGYSYDNLSQAFGIEVGLLQGLFN